MPTFCQGHGPWHVRLGGGNFLEGATRGPRHGTKLRDTGKCNAEGHPCACVVALRPPPPPLRGFWAPDWLAWVDWLRFQGWFGNTVQEEGTEC